MLRNKFLQRTILMAALGTLIFLAKDKISASAGEATGSGAVGANALLEEIVEGGDTDIEATDVQNGDVQDGNSEVDSKTAETENSQKDVAENVSSEPSKFSSLPKALSCSFIIPEDFNLSDTPGQYVNEHYPLESANITYNVTSIPQPKALTNAEKASGKVADEGVDYRYDELTSEMYESIQKENYEQLYGENINFTLESFENKQFDGFPGFLIRSCFTPENSQTIHQVSVIVLSSNKVFTIVFSRAEDDDFEEAINESLESIHVLAAK